MQAWRQEQQILATSAAREEERALSSWWQAEAKKLWALQSRRRRDHEELARRQGAEVAALENQRVDVSEGFDRVGYLLLLLLFQYTPRADQNTSGKPSVIDYTDTSKHARGNRIEEVPQETTSLPSR